jgi:hypothetical protein
MELEELKKRLMNEKYEMEQERRRKKEEEEYM